MLQSSWLPPLLHSPTHFPPPPPPTRYPHNNSSHVQSSYHPSGKYLRTTNGIFFSRSSLIAICSGSVSPSISTSTGAFILSYNHTTSAYQHKPSPQHPVTYSAPLQKSKKTSKGIPNLQRPRPQHPRPLILGHVRRRAALPARNLLLAQAHDGVFFPAPGVYRYHVLVVGSTGTSGGGSAVGKGRGGIVWVVAVGAGGAGGAVRVLDVVGVGGVEFGLRVVEGGFGGFVVVAGEEGG